MGQIVYRVWLLGVSGQLGQVIYHWSRENQIVVFSSDISQNKKIKEWLSVRDKYRIVVNAAAMTAVGGCETDECRAFEVNALGPKYLAENVTRQGGTLLHVSTDYVFPGTDPTHEDFPRPFRAAIGVDGADGISFLAGRGIGTGENVVGRNV